MSTRKIHYSRLLDFVSGSAFAAAKTKVQKSAIYKDFDQKNLSIAFRDIIGRNLPSFYIVDPELIVKEMLDGLKNSASKIVSSVYLDSGTSFSGDSDFDISVANVIDTNRTKLEAGLLKEITAGLLSIKSANFTSFYGSLDTIYNKLLAELGTAKTYVSYRNAAIRAGYDVRKILSTINTIRLEDGPDIVVLPSKTAMVFIGPTFNKLVTDINKVVADKAKTFLESNNINFKAYDNKTKEGFYVGQFINAGHTAAFGPGKELIGVNMPSAQEVQFALGNSAEALKLETDLSKIYADVEYEVNFTQNFTSQAKTLLNLQFSFVVTMPAKLNTADINIAEQKRIRRLSKEVIIPTLKETLNSKFKGGVIDLVPDISASPTLTEFVKNSILETLKGNSTTKVTKSNKAKGAQKLELPISVKSKKKVPLTGNKKSTQISIKVNSTTVKNVQKVEPLSSLQAILDKSLAEQIRKNMGTGSSRNVLNYRTGRLAASAKVERLSRSREGMITAFYTYMKNPYATFSEGGLQGSPKTRDPKLLISKSIREIGTTLAYNRMRAVLV